MIDALENKRSRDTKTGNVIESNTKKANSNEGDSVNGRTKRKVVGTDERKETEAPEQVTSPWINTGSFHQKTKASPTTSMRKISTTFANLLSADGGKQQKFDGITYKRMGSRVTNLQKREECKLGDSRKKDKDAVDANEETHSEAPEKVTSSLIGTRSFHNKIPLPTTSVKRNKPGRAQHAAITHSEQSFATHLHAAGSKQQKFDEVTDKRMGGTVGNSQDSEECTIVSANEVLASNKAVTEGKKEGERTETLKKKLQEIFGTHTSSPKSSQGLGHSNLKLKQIHHQRDNSAANPIQNSDTIETDSENPDCKIMRPVTCSLTRIRVATKVRPAKTKTGPSSSVEHKFHEKNVFSSEEGLFEKRDVGNGGCLMSARKNGSEKNSGIKPRKIYFSKNNIENEVQGVTCRREMPPPVQKASSLRDKSRSSHGGSPQGEDKRPKLRNASLKGGSHQSARENMVDQPADSISPFVPMNGHQQEKFGSQGKKNVTVMQEESLSPTFKPNTPTSSSSPSSTPKSHPAEFRVYSPVATEKEFTPRNIYSWKNLQTSKVDLHASNAKVESSVSLSSEAFNVYLVARI